jgi:hypothetical protein
MKVLFCHNYCRHPGGGEAAYLAERELLPDFEHQVLDHVRRNVEIRVDGFLSKAGLGLKTI